MSFSIIIFVWKREKIKSKNKPTAYYKNQLKRYIDYIDTQLHPSSFRQTRDESRDEKNTAKSSMKENFATKILEWKKKNVFKEEKCRM